MWTFPYEPVYFDDSQFLWRRWWFSSWWKVLLIIELCLERSSTWPVHCTNQFDTVHIFKDEWCESRQSNHGSNHKPKFCPQRIALLQNTTKWFTFLFGSIQGMEMCDMEAWEVVYFCSLLEWRHNLLTARKEPTTTQIITTRPNLLPNTHTTQ